MSGGTFDYFQYRITDAVEEIERRIRNNRKTVLEHWNECSQDARDCLSEYGRPWTAENYPSWVEGEACKAADKELGLTGTYNTEFSKWPKKKKDKWNEVRRETINRLIEEQNNSYIGADYSDATIAKLKEMIPVIKKAEIYLNRIDWLFAGDDGEDSFLERTKEDLKEEGLADGD